MPRDPVGPNLVASRVFMASSSLLWVVSTKTVEAAARAAPTPVVAHPQVRWRRVRST